MRNRHRGGWLLRDGAQKLSRTERMCVECNGCHGQMTVWISCAPGAELL